MRKKLTMLIAEDNERNRTQFQKIYEEEYHVLIATNGCEALEILQKEDVDIMILALDMPCGEGEKVIRQMKKSERWENIPIIVKTVKYSKAQAKQLGMGADDCLVMPEDMEAVKNSVENMVKHCVNRPKVFRYSEMSLLIIDDDALACEFTKLHIRRLGMRYQVADSAELAVKMIADAIAADRPFAMCLINGQMHQSDSAAVVNKIRERFDENQLLISCVCRECGSEQASTHSGADYILEWPITQEKLYRLMTNVQRDLEKKHEKYTLQNNQKGLQ